MSSSRVVNKNSRKQNQSSYVQHHQHGASSLEELNYERGYLISSLNHEDVKATQLLSHIAILEEKLHSELQNITACRKYKKHLSWLRSRLSETTKQEKSILTRLGQVTYEIQNKERRNRIQLERRAYDDRMRNGMQQMTLDAAMPDFTIYGAHGIPNLQMENHYYSHELMLPFYHVHSGLPSNANVYDQVSSRKQINDSNFRGRSASVPDEETSLDKQELKRLSLPTWTLEWEDLGDVRDDRRYSYAGYYMRQ